VISLSVSTSDYHTAGEPFRIVTDPPVVLPGDSVADRRARTGECTFVVDPTDPLVLGFVLR
jgi:hypothetical protein